MWHRFQVYGRKNWTLNFNWGLSWEKNAATDPKGKYDKTKPTNDFEFILLGAVAVLNSSPTILI